MSEFTFGQTTFETTQATGRACRAVMPAFSSIQAGLTRYSVQLRMYSLSEDRDAVAPRLVFDEDDMDTLIAFISAHTTVLTCGWEKGPLDFLQFEELFQLATAIMKPADALSEAIKKKSKGGSGT